LFFSRSVDILFTHDLAFSRTQGVRAMKALLPRRVVILSLALAAVCSFARGTSPGEETAQKGGEFRTSKASKVAPSPNGGFQTIPEGKPYRPSDVLFLSAEFENVPCKRDRSGTHYQVEWKVTITGADGKVVHQHTSAHAITLAQPLDKYPYSYQQGLARFQPGRYTLSFEMVDVHSGRSAKGSVKFAVVSPEWKDVGPIT
jgi:hypothetical protein